MKAYLMKRDVLTQLCTMFCIPRLVNDVRVPTPDFKKKKKKNLGKGRWKEKKILIFSMCLKISQNIIPLGDA